MTDWRQKARLRPAELAEVASVSLRTIWRKLESGEIESFTQGRSRFIPIKAALAFVGDGDTPRPQASVRARSVVDRLRQGVG